MKILVVDDEKFNLIVAQDFINTVMNNCTTILCSSPLDVMGILENEEIDIILMDIIMPGMTGIEVLEIIRSKSKFNNIQILMLTSIVDKENFKRCFEIGADDYILKPIDITEFSARLKAAAKTRSNALILKESLERINEQNKELKELNQKLEDSQFHIIQKEKLASIGELAAGIAHEINNPIGFIGSNLETMNNFIGKVCNMTVSYKDFIEKVKTSLAEDNLELNENIENLKALEKKYKIDFVINELQDMINDSRDGIDRISKIVQSLKEFARTGFEDDKNYNDLNKIIEETLLIIRNEAKYIIDIVDTKGDIPDIVCNKVQISQVILNILVNAIQAIKSLERIERGKILIETYGEGNYVYCKIADDGPGMSKEVIDKIFNPFFTTKPVGQGTGLGMSISFDIIVKKHNGEFIVNSEPGKGATFIIKLPVESHEELI